MRTLPGRLALASVLCLAPQLALGQSPASRLIEQARGEIDALNVDSAFTILQLALRRAPTGTERVRAFTLLGITQLSRDDRVGARSALEQALRLDPALRVDSLAELHTDLRTVFGEVRTALGITDAPRDASGTGVPRLAAVVSAPRDTVVPGSGGRLLITTVPSYRARVVLTITPVAEPGRLLWSDTAAVGATAAQSWNLRGPEGRIVPAGRYALRAYASDSLGEVSPTSERVLVIDRVAVDTVAAAEPAGPLLPETAVLGHGPTRGLASGLIVALSAVALPSILGNSELQTGASYPTSYAVAAVVSAASAIAFLRGNQTRPLPENVRLNAQNRERLAAERLRAAEENTRRRDAAPIRVRLEGLGR